MKALLFRGLGLGVDSCVRLGVGDSLVTGCGLGLDAGTVVDLLGLDAGTVVGLLGLDKSTVVGLLGLDAGTVVFLREKKVWMPVVMPSWPYRF